MKITLFPLRTGHLSRMALLMTCLFQLGCNSTYRLDPASAGPGREGSMVFVRPDKFSVLGTRSLRDYFEVTYEEFSMNEANQPVVKFGIRNRGGQRWYDLKGPNNLVVAAKAVFYKRAVTGREATGAPVYETNWQKLPVTRGGTLHYDFTSPVPAQGYQIILSDALN